MRDPNGNNPRTIYRDDSYIRSTGLRAQLTPDGDCREAAFEAKGAGLRVPPLSNLQVEYLHNGVWTPLWYGEVRVGGNARDVNGERYVLRTLARRLGEITLPPGFSTPQQSAHLTVRAILRAVMDSGQLGTFPVIEYDEGRCPDLGFDCRAVVNANQQTPAALLEQIAEDGAGLGVTVAWGVGADRFFFCRPARTDTAELEAPTGNPLIPGSTIGLTWQPPVAETPCTAVLWYLLKAPNGAWATHLSRSPEADRYGLRVKTMSFPTHVPAFEVGEYMVAANDGSGEVILSGATAAVLSDGDSPRITRPEADLPWGYVRAYSNEGAELSVLSAAENQDVYAIQTLTRRADVLHLAVEWLNGVSSQNRVEVSFGPSILAIYTAADFAGQKYGEPGGLSVLSSSPRPLTLYNLPEGTQLRFIGKADSSGTTPGRRKVAVQIRESRPEVPNTALLDGLAKYHYSTPAQEPADIETLTFRPPRDLAGRVSVGDYNRAVEAWEYRLTAARGLTLAALTGQADDPAKLAQASLIKQRDGQATVNALTAQQ